MSSYSELIKELQMVVDSMKDHLERQLELGFTQIPSDKKPQKVEEKPQIQRPFAEFNMIELKTEAEMCARCKLCEARRKVVFGSGSEKATLMFVGEAPGYEEDIQGEPFVGRAGQLLTKIIQAIDLERDSVYIANVVKCRPPENRNPMPEEIETCEPFLIRQLELIRPQIICALGTFAAQTLLKTNERISNLRGRFHPYKISNLEIKVMPTYHPAFLLRNPEFKREVWEDMKLVKAECLKL